MIPFIRASSGSLRMFRGLWVLCALFALQGRSHASLQASTTRVSVSSSGAQGNDESSRPWISADGRFVAFASRATNIVGEDTNAAQDIFVRDLSNAATALVSVDSAGVQGDADSESASISADGRYVAFASLATNLVAGDRNGFQDIFVRDRSSGVTALVSVDSSAVQANGSSRLPTISADGRYVAFHSVATNLVSGDTNAVEDVFVHDLVSGHTSRESVDSAGAQQHTTAPFSGLIALSSDGGLVAFDSNAPDLVSGDNNSKGDVFVRERSSGVTARVSVDSTGAQGNDRSEQPSLSADGRYVAFASLATNLVLGDVNGEKDVFLHDRSSGVTSLVSVDSSGAQGNGWSWRPSISADGRYIAFLSDAGNFAPSNNTFDVFVHDRQTGWTTCVSVDSPGFSADDFSESPSISADGRWIAFESWATRLVVGDTNDVRDVFLRDRGLTCHATAVYCTAKVNSAGCTPTIGWSGTPSASAGSGFVIGAEQVLPNKLGLLFYSTKGPQGSGFQGGKLCAAFPTKRTPLQTAAGSGSPPCTGIYSFDFNARIASGVDPMLVLGRQVWTQFWSRDSGAFWGTGLTDGLTFIICD